MLGVIEICDFHVVFEPAGIILYKNGLFYRLVGLHGGGRRG